GNSVLRGDICVHELTDTQCLPLQKLTALQVRPDPVRGYVLGVPITVGQDTRYVVVRLTRVPLQSHQKGHRGRNCCCQYLTYPIIQNRHTQPPVKSHAYPNVSYGVGPA